MNTLAVYRPGGSGLVKSRPENQPRRCLRRFFWRRTSQYRSDEPESSTTSSQGLHSNSRSSSSSRSVSAPSLPIPPHIHSHHCRLCRETSKSHLRPFLSPLSYRQHRMDKLPFRSGSYCTSVREYVFSRVYPHFRTTWFLAFCFLRRDFDRPNTFAVRFSLVQYGVCWHNKFLE